MIPTFSGTCENRVIPDDSPPSVADAQIVYAAPINPQPDDHVRCLKQILSSSGTGQCKAFWSTIYYDKMRFRTELVQPTRWLCLSQQREEDRKLHTSCIFAWQVFHLGIPNRFVRLAFTSGRVYAQSYLCLYRGRRCNQLCHQHMAFWWSLTSVEQWLFIGGFDSLENWKLERVVKRSWKVFGEKSHRRDLFWNLL
jgi:hypothetical protein